jgi:hypothetical protein
MYRLIALALFLVPAMPAVLYAEDCPDGYEEREESCSPTERSAGCRDVRLDDGTGCVYLPEEDTDEECPDGYEERDSGCSEEEREEGCSDVRLDSGKGCVSL